MENRGFWSKHAVAGMWIVGLVITGLVLLLIFGLLFGVKNYTRYQKRADAQNQVAVNEIQIRQTAQLVQVQKQKAQVRVEEARGIAESQRLINNTLTPLYLQHEAIQSQESQANKIIYVPSGAQGIPMVQTVNPQN